MTRSSIDAWVRMFGAALIALAAIDFASTFAQAAFSQMRSIPQIGRLPGLQYAVIGSLVPLFVKLFGGFALFAGSKFFSELIHRVEYDEIEDRGQ